MHRLLFEADVPIQFEGPRGWIIATLIAVVVLVFFGLPIFEKVREAIGKAAEPKITEHNECPEAHPDVRMAVALLNASIEDVQRQINAMGANHKDSLESLNGKLQLAVELLRKE